MPGSQLIGKEELDQLRDIFNNGGVLFRHGFDDLRGDCYKVLEFEKNFSVKINASYCLAVSSGTAALRVALAALEIGPGDEVIVPAFTFVATAEAVIEAGANPICANIDDTLNLNPREISRLINRKTKAVLVVHMLGVPARLKEISAQCEKYGISMIEDTAWGCGGSLLGKKLGTWGDIGAFSFDYAKTITTGEGGMVVSNNQTLFKKAMAWHDHGHENNPEVPRWEDTRSSSGFNFRMTEMQGAIGIAQLAKLDFIVNKQRENRDEMWEGIKEIPNVTGREMPVGSMDTADALTFSLPNSELALKCRNELLSLGMRTKILPEAITWHFAGCWSHMSSLVRANGGDLEAATSLSRQILSKVVCLPVSLELEVGEVDKLRKAVTSTLSN